MSEEAKYAAAEASLAAERAQQYLGAIIEGSRVYEQSAARLTEAAGNVAIAAAQTSDTVEAAEAVTYPMIELSRNVLYALDSLPRSEVQDIVHLVKEVKAAAAMVYNNGIEPVKEQLNEVAGMSAEIEAAAGQLTSPPDVTNGSYSDIAIGRGLLDQFIASV